MTNQERSEIIKILRTLSQVLENPNQSPKARERFTQIFKLANAIIKQAKRS